MAYIFLSLRPVAGSVLDGTAHGAIITSCDSSANMQVIPGWVTSTWGYWVLMGRTVLNARVWRLPVQQCLKSSNREDPRAVQ